MKRLLWILALAALIWAPAGALAAGEPFVLTLSDSALLVSGQGQAVTQPGEYDYIEPLGDGIFAAICLGEGQRSAWIIGEDGQPALERAFEDVYAADGQIYAMENGLVGVLDQQLQWKIPAAYTQLVYDGQSGYLALSSDPYDTRPDGVYYVDEQGVERATGIRVQYGLSRFSEGLMPVMDGVSGRMGYLDRQGNWAITPQYDYAGEFLNGVAEAALAAGAGYIDAQGNWLLTPKYAAVSRSMDQGGLVLAQENSGEVLLFSAPEFQLVKRFEGEDIYFSAAYSAELAVLYLDDCTQLIDAQGQVLVECGLEASFDAWGVQDGRVLARLGSWGEDCVWLYDLEGNRVAGPWQDAWMLGKAGDQTLYAVSAFEVYESVDVDDAFHVYQEVDGTRTIQVVDQDGTQVIPQRPMLVLYMDDQGRLIYEDANGAGVMDLEGNQICYFSLDQGEVSLDQGEVSPDQEEAAG